MLTRRSVRHVVFRIGESLITNHANLVKTFVGPLAETKVIPWRDYFLDVYFWEQNYTQTPTLFSLRVASTNTQRTTGFGIRMSCSTLKQSPGKGFRYC
ncbi:hypothetical protein Poly41_14510 [Novipirellula artificiosorum]|uniref:Uncharacterized protein n=1 Tax=Novipirellula artificiosorum TaxID=2528016 RepID=A0A5C6DXQ4_9BACT|nr:hypothetical protein Poly41_14510 [Novipirellula artificiosorum]